MLPSCNRPISTRTKSRNCSAHKTNYAPKSALIWRIIVCSWRIKLSKPKLRPLVAGGAGYRVFTKDIPSAPNHAAMAYYLMALAALGYIIKPAPLLLTGR
jgi:hypothetical protein